MRRMDFTEHYWENTLDQLEETGTFRLTDFHYSPDEEDNLLTVLRDLEAHRYIERTPEEEFVWKAGPKMTILIGLIEAEAKQPRE
jgi:hypothetical protein